MFLLILEEAENSSVPVCSLHSNMFLLIPFYMLNYMSRQGQFRFQYVYINTTRLVWVILRITGFTFQYVSINTFFAAHNRRREQTGLHSNMFLLILRLSRCSKQTLARLHSNMFLLIRLFSNLNLTQLPCLHSNMFLLIRLLCSETYIIFCCLHSNMFLLIPAPLNHQLILPYYTIFCRPWYFFIFLFISI